jgi:hypothetical protein
MQWNSPLQGSAVGPLSGREGRRGGTRGLPLHRRATSIHPTSHSTARRAFVGKSFARSLEEARFAFFSEDLPRGDLIRYQAQLAACSPVRLLDLAALNKVRGALWHALLLGGCGSVR